MELLHKKNYLSAIQLADGIKVFRHLYAIVDGEEKDILEDGNLSCPMFVCFMLLPFKLVREMHATVPGAIRDLKDSGWYEISEPKEGAIIVWEKKTDGGLAESGHKHIGFYLGNNLAVSNSSEVKQSIVHAADKGDRKIIATYWHEFLN